jgi:hypothetical protein
MTDSEWFAALTQGGKDGNPVVIEITPDEANY